MALTLDNSGSFTRVATKRKTKVSVGFEWEIPADIQERSCCCDDCDPDDECYCDYEEYVEMDTATEDFISTHGFRTHIECGGVEFASPIFGNISTARRIANALKEVSLKDRALGQRDYDEHCCGIHVHAGYAGWEPNERHQYGIPVDVDAAYKQVTGMLNRKSSAAFVMEFSGREQGGYSYKDQARSTCWDAKGATTPSEDQQVIIRDRQMVRPNCFNGVGTVEYRLWYTSEDRLLPAIEFAHACTTFITTRKDIPFLKDFKVWLDKQAGYRILKQDEAWALV